MRIGAGDELGQIDRAILIGSPPAPLIPLGSFSIDRMYLNVYVPRLQTDSAAAYSWRFHRGHRFSSSP